MTTISEPDTMALAVTGVTKHYDSGFVLDDVTFDLPKGYIMGLIGPNGAGKSTLIKLILNMIRRDHGSIQVLGLDNIIEEEAVKEQLGVVFDSSYLYEQWKVSKVERIVAPLYPAWNGERYRRYLDDFGLGGAQNGKKKIKDLSRGMQMKLMLAIALSHDAKLLILDEPTSGLDVLARDELMDMLHAYIEDGEHSVLFSTHITVDLERAADFIAYITGGRLYYTGPKDEFEESFRIVKGGRRVGPAACRRGAWLAHIPDRFRCAGALRQPRHRQRSRRRYRRRAGLHRRYHPPDQARDSVASSPEAASALKEVGHGNVD